MDIFRSIYRQMQVAADGTDRFHMVSMVMGDKHIVDHAQLQTVVVEMFL